MPNGPRCRPDSPASVQATDRRADDALTDLHGYALLLDAECHRMGDRLSELANETAPGTDLSTLVRQRADLAEELEAFRGAIAELRRELRSDRIVRCSSAT
jgi:hypothetical protein